MLLAAQKGVRKKFGMNSKEEKKFSRLHNLTCLLKSEIARALMRV